MTYSRKIAAALAASVCVVAIATPAQAQVRQYNIGSGSLKSALDAYARQSGRQVIYKSDEVRSARSKGAKGAMSADDALDAVLAGSGFDARKDASGALAIVRAPSVASGEAVAGSAAARNESAEAAPRGVISGKVVDLGTGAALKGALVEIVETGQTTSTDDLGAFRFSGFTDGKYNIRISYLGYGDAVAEATLASGRGSHQKFELRGGSANAEIVVYGQRSARAQALNKERTAENSSTVLSSDLLGDFAGTTLSESLRRAPGVTFQRDPVTGDGTNISIRGLAPDLNTVKLNGVELPEGSGTGRSASLGNILTESISQVTIHKTLLPNHDSAGSGGLVEIETKSPLDRPRRFASFALEGARRASSKNSDFLASGTISGRFGESDQFGLSASVQYRSRRVQRIAYGSDLVFGQYLPRASNGAPIPSPIYLDPTIAFPFEQGASSVYPISSSVNVDESTGRNLSISIAAAWAIGNHTNLSLDYQRIHNSETTLLRQTSFSASGDYSLMPIIALGGQQRYFYRWFGRLRGDSSYQYNPNQKNDTDVISFRGTTKLGPLTLDYRLGHTSGQTSVPQNQLITTLRPNGFLDPSQYDPSVIDPVQLQITSIFPARRDSSFPLPLLTAAGFNLLRDPGSYRFTEASFLEFNGVNKRDTADVTAKYEFSNGILRYLEVGASYEKSRFDNGSSDRVSFSPNDIATLKDLGLTLPEDSLSDVGIDSRLNIIAASDLKDLFAYGLDDIIVRSPGLLSRQKFVENAEVSKGFTDERELVGYLQGRIDIGKLEVVGGVRMSRLDLTSAFYTSPVIYNTNSVFDQAFFNANAKTIVDDARQTSFLPRVLANLRLTENTIFRAGYYLSIARPQVRLLTSRQQVSLYQAGLYGPSNSQAQLRVQQGNPDLRPSSTHSFDVGMEMYDKSVGVAKVNLFYKHIDNLLETNSAFGVGSLDNVILPADPRFGDVKSNPQNYYIQVNTPANNPDPGRIWGAEIAVEKQFTFFPGVLSGLGVYANYTYTDSSKTLSLGYLDPTNSSNRSALIRGVPFDGQSKHSGTVGLTYNKSGFDGNIAYTFQSRRQIQYMANNLGSFEEPHGTLDARIEYRTQLPGTSVRVFAEGADLLRGKSDPAYRSTQGAGDGITGKYYTGARYFGGRQVRGGVVVTF